MSKGSFLFDLQDTYNAIPPPPLSKLIAINIFFNDPPCSCLSRLLGGRERLSSLSDPDVSLCRDNPARFVQILGRSSSAAASFSRRYLCEFEEKRRTHIGKITNVEHKSSGGARYRIVDAEGKKVFDVADKAVTYSMPCPTSPAPAEKLFQEFSRAQDTPLDTIQQELDMSPELLEMAWEEAAEGEESDDHLVTAASLIELVHGHAASAMEKYLAWQLLKTDMAHVFFKEIKDHGRVVAFKAKTRKAVEAAKQAFCQSHTDSYLCLV